MKAPGRFAALAVLALPFTFGGYSHSFAHAQPRPGIPAALHHDDDDKHDWKQEARRRGHEDGMHAAYDDMQHGRQSDPDRHPDFRHPPVNKHARDVYRDAFRDGYREGYQNGSRRDRDHDRDDHRHDNYNPY